MENNNEILGIFKKATETKAGEDSLKLFYELLKAISNEDEAGVLALYQAYKSLNPKSSTAGKEFEKALMARMTAILWSYKAERCKYDDSFSSLYKKEKGEIDSKISSFINRIIMTTGYSVNGFFIYKEFKFWEWLRGRFEKT